MPTRPDVALILAASSFNYPVRLVMVFLWFILFALFVRPFIVLLHELGHAVMVMALTRRPAAIYLLAPGSDPVRYLRLSWLKVYFSPSWRLPICGGYCQAAEPRLSPLQYALFVLAGPLTPALLGTLFFLLVHRTDASPILQLLLFIFMVFSILSFFFNLRPNPTPITLPDGTITYNDGQLLLRLWRNRHAHHLLYQAQTLYQQREYARAAVLFKQCLPLQPEPVEALTFCVSALALASDYEQAFGLSQELREEYPDTATQPHVWNTHALILSRLDRHAEALKEYTALLAAHPEYVDAYNNRGFTHHLLSQYESALADFEQALRLQPDTAYSLANRGLALTMLGEPAAGLADIERARHLAPDHAYVCRSLGLYHLERGEAAQAAEHFRHAQALDAETQGIAQLLAQAEAAATQVTYFQ